MQGQQNIKKDRTKLIVTFRNFAKVPKMFQTHKNTRYATFPVTLSKDRTRWQRVKTR